MTTITDADRKAAEAWRRDYGRKGSYQDLLQAFARHREQALEEAADKVARLMRTATPEQCAAAIRALIGETK